MSPARIFGRSRNIWRHPTGSLSTSGLRAWDFEGLSGLTSLQLRGTGLTALPAGVFDDLTALTSLTLSGNALTALPPGIFDKNTALRNLALAINSLTALPEGVFEKLTALTLSGLTLASNPGTSTFLPVANAGADVTARGGARRRPCRAAPRGHGATT